MIAWMSSARRPGSPFLTPASCVEGSILVPATLSPSPAVVVVGGLVEAGALPVDGTPVAPTRAPPGGDTAGLPPHEKRIPAERPAPASAPPHPRNVLFRMMRP